MKREIIVKRNAEPALEVLQVENGKNTMKMSYSKGNEITECSLPSQTFRVLVEGIF